MTTFSDDESPRAASSQSLRPVRLTDRADFEALREHESPVLIEFYTKGCTLCQSIEPVLGNVARATGMTVGMINPQFDLDLIDDYRIRSVPTLILFEHGTEVGRLADGFQGADSIIDFMTQHVEVDSTLDHDIE